MQTGMPTSLILRTFGPERGAAAIREAGFDAVDYSEPIFCYQAYEGVYTLPEKQFEAHFIPDRDALRRAGLRVRQVHAPYHTIPDDERETEFMRAAIRRAIHAAAVVDGEYLVIHPAQPMHWMTDTDPRGTRAYNKALFEELLPIARAEGIRLALENMPGAGIPCGTPESHLDYIDMMGDPEYFTACLDTGHANFSRVDCAYWVRALGPRLRCLHVHDNHGNLDEHLLPHLGNIAWEPFHQALHRIGYDGVYSLEDSFCSSFRSEKLLPGALRFAHDVADEINR